MRRKKIICIHSQLLDRMHAICAPQRQAYGALLRAVHTACKGVDIDGTRYAQHGQIRRRYHARTEHVFVDDRNSEP